MSTTTLVAAPGAFEHRHQWVRQADSVSFFLCAVPGCCARACCPGCLNSPITALRLDHTSLHRYWCRRHV